MSYELKLAHLVTHVRSLGGMYSMVRRHWQHDAQWNFQSQVITVFEKGVSPMERVTDLGMSWKNNIREARRALSDALPRHRLDITIYHNLWGLPFFADIDPAGRRIGLLHSDWPGLDSLLPFHRGLLDGLMCVSEPLVQLAYRALPDLGEDRITRLPIPIDAPPSSSVHPSLADRPIILGCCGRIAKAQKRIDRLPLLCEELDRSGLRYQIELLGDGPDRAWLQRQLQGRNQVRFHGQRQGDAYWKILEKWDVIFFLSDFEGLPLALLEAMSQGALPLFPKINCGGDAYAARISSRCLYSPGDYSAMARMLKELVTMRSEEITQLRQKSREAVLPHLGDCYQKAFSQFVRKIHAQPRQSIHPVPGRPFFWLDWCPFGLLRRVFYRHFFRPNVCYSDEGKRRLAATA